MDRSDLKYWRSVYISSPWGWRLSALLAVALVFVLVKNSEPKQPGIVNVMPTISDSFVFTQAKVAAPPAPVVPVAAVEAEIPSNDQNAAILAELNAKVDRARTRQMAVTALSNACHLKTRGGPKGALTTCITPIVNANGSEALDYVPHAACAKFGYCNGHGTCFIGKCFCEPGRAGEGCELIDPRPLPKCSISSDACFRNPEYGRLRIPYERWLRASWAEQEWWTSPDRADEDNDNAGASRSLFEDYSAVPDNLGHVIELGCGPFTQLKSILGVPGRSWHVETVTLSDPILVVESKHAKSSFRTGSFEAHGVQYPTKLIQVGAEEVGSLYHDKFDTVIMQNVLEHVNNAYAVLESLYNITKPGGVLVFWEPTYSQNWKGWTEDSEPLVFDISKAFDRMAHPIRADMELFRYFASFFEPLMIKETWARRGDNSMILVGRKKKPTEKPYF